MDNIVDEPADVNETPAQVAPSDAADEPLAEVTADSEPAGSAAGEPESFHDEDREAMARRILATRKTVLAFKILAANRKTASPADRREAFRWAYAHIKPGDAVVVGMFPKYGDQVRENVGYALEFGA